MDIIQKKILHISVGLNKGGAEGVLFRIINYDRSACHVVVSMMDLGDYGKKLENIGIRVYCLNFPRGKLTYRGVKKLWQLIRKEKPDIVQTWMYHADLIGGTIARLAGVKKVFWGIRHSDLSFKANKKSTLIITRLSAFFSYFIPEKIISCSQAATNAHLKVGYAKKFIYIPNGYNIDDISSDKKIKLKPTVSGVVLGMVGRFHPQKNHANLFHALSILDGNNIDFQCVLAGTDITNKNIPLQALIKKFNLSSRVVLLGQRNDIPAIMSTLDIHILSSLGEAFPNVLAEAMACKTPCVSTDVGDAKYIVGDTGWIVPSGNSILLAEAIEAGLNEKRNNPYKWKNREERARKRIKNDFSFEKMITLYHSVWL